MTSPFSQLFCIRQDTIGNTNVIKYKKTVLKGLKRWNQIIREVIQKLFSIWRNYSSKKKKKENTGEGWDIQNAGHTDCWAMKNAGLWKGAALGAHWCKGGGSLSTCWFHRGWTTWPLLGPPRKDCFQYQSWDHQRNAAISTVAVRSKRRERKKEGHFPISSLTKGS